MRHLLALMCRSEISQVALDSSASAAAARWARSSGLREIHAQAMREAWADPQRKAVWSAKLHANCKEEMRAIQVRLGKKAVQKVNKRMADPSTREQAIAARHEKGMRARAVLRADPQYVQAQRERNSAAQLRRLEDPVLMARAQERMRWAQLHSPAGAARRARLAEPLGAPKTP